MTQLDRTMPWQAKFSIGAEISAKETMKQQERQWITPLTSPSPSFISVCSDRVDSPLTKSQRRVRFNESENVYYPGQAVLGEEELVARWYGFKDYETFSQHTQEMANNGSTQQVQVFRDWACLFYALRTGSRVDDETKRHLTIDAHTLGLQKYAWDCPIRADYYLRQSHLMQQIYRIQQQTGVSPELRARVIRETSLLTSQASRNYAHIMAQVAATQNDN